MNHSHKYFDINNKVYKDIKAYLQEKELLLKQQVNSSLFLGIEHHKNGRWHSFVNLESFRRRHLS